MVVIYFDPRPKTKKEDLFNRDKELKEPEQSVKNNPLTVISGVRRIGKTSLLQVGLNELQIPHIIVDFRNINPRSKESLYRNIESSINNFFKKNEGIWNNIKEKLRNISGIQIAGTGINLSWGDDRTDLSTLFKELETYNVVLTFDEVQSLRGPIGKNFKGIIAHLYDYSELNIILTGSEVGLLYDFIGIEDPDAALYGREYKEIKLKKFNKETSQKFLKKGFKQTEKEINKELLEKAVNNLDGIVGWLVKFGRKSTQKEPSKETLQEVLEEAKRLARNEFEGFLSNKHSAKNRYKGVMESIAKNENKWKEIKTHLERLENQTISDSVLNRILTNLRKASFIKKVKNGRNIHYEITDPILKQCYQTKT